MDKIINKDGISMPEVRLKTKMRSELEKYEINE